MPDVPQPQVPLKYTENKFEVDLANDPKPWPPNHNPFQKPIIGKIGEKVTVGPFKPSGGSAPHSVACYTVGGTPAPSLGTADSAEVTILRQPQQVSCRFIDSEGRYGWSPTIAVRAE